MSEQVKVGIVDDHPLMREGIGHILSRSGRFSVIRTGNSCSEAVRMADESLLDLMLLDINMPGGGIEAARAIASRHPDVKLVMLTISESQDDVLEAMAVGARGYVLKGISGNDLIQTLLSIVDGQSYVTPQLAARLLSRPASAKSAQPYLDDLSSRENEIMTNVAKGLTNKEIARVLNLSEKTIKFYMTNVMQKLHVRNRMEAALALRDKNGHTTNRPTGGA